MIRERTRPPRIFARQFARRRELQDLTKDEVAAHIQCEVSRQLEELGSVVVTSVPVCLGSFCITRDTMLT
jgi:hypothetical protein